MSKLKRRINVDYVFQDLDMLPAGISCPAKRQNLGHKSAVLSAEEKIKEPFAVINADDYYGRNSFKIMHDYLSTIQEHRFLCNDWLPATEHSV